MGNLIEIKKDDVETVEIALKTSTDGAAFEPVDLSGASSVVLTATDDDGTTVFTLAVGTGLTVTSASTGKITAAFSAQHTATVSTLNWVVVVKWPAVGPLTWPKRGAGQLRILPRQ